MTIAGVIAPNLSVSAQDCSKSENIIHPEMTKTGTNDDGIKPILRPAERVGNSDDSVKKILPRIERSGNSDDSVKKILPRIERSGNSDDSI